MAGIAGVHHAVPLALPLRHLLLVPYSCFPAWRLRPTHTAAPTTVALLRPTPCVTAPPVTRIMQLVGAADGGILLADARWWSAHMWYLWRRNSCSEMTTDLPRPAKRPEKRRPAPARQQKASPPVLHPIAAL